MSNLIYDDRIDQIIGTDHRSQIDVEDINKAIKRLSAAQHLFPNLTFYNFDDGGFDTAWTLVTVRSEELSEERIKEIFEDFLNR